MVKTCQMAIFFLHDFKYVRQQAVIDPDDSWGLILITDTSKNGTWVNGIRVAAGSSKDLGDGDTIRIGEFNFQVVSPDDAWAEDTYEWPTELTLVSPKELLVTNLVADVRGFSAFSQDHSATEVYGLIKEIFGRFTAVVNEFSGTIKDYAGDAIFAFWDHRMEPSTTQAALACQAAVQQMQTLNRILAELSGKYSGVETLHMGWGITTGRVMMSHYGSRAADLALVGDCINLAFRFSGIANRERPEKILICSQTAELVCSDLEVGDLGMVPIRGRKGKERVFVLNEPE